MDFHSNSCDNSGSERADLREAYRYFGLRENPFNGSPDPRYLFFTPDVREAFDTLRFGIEARRGLLVLTGEVGTGKTTLVNGLITVVQKRRGRTAFVFNPRLEARHLFDLMLADFEIPSDPPAGGHRLRLLRQWLIGRQQAGEVCVLIVDEAQGLSLDLLEEVRLLLNLETPREKLLQVVLAGQPELEETLKRHPLRQLRQRIALRCRTVALTGEQTRAYVDSRLGVAGGGAGPLFTSEAVRALHFYARGIPRVINLLGENALIHAYVGDLRPVPARIVDEVAHEFQFDDFQRGVLHTSGEEDSSAAGHSLGVEPERATPRSVPAADRSSAPVASASPFFRPERSAPQEAFPSASLRAPKLEIVKGQAEEPSPAIDDSAAFTSEDAFRLLAALASGPGGASGPSPWLAPSKKNVSPPSPRERAGEGAVPRVPVDPRAERVREMQMWIAHWAAVWKDRSSSAVVLCGRAARRSTWLRWLQQPASDPLAWMQQALVWRQGPPSAAGWPRMSLSVLRWLQEPWSESAHAAKRGAPI